MDDITGNIVMNVFTLTMGVTVGNGKIRDLVSTDLWVTQVCVPDPGLCTGLLKFYLYTIKCFE